MFTDTYNNENIKELKDTVKALIETKMGELFTAEHKVGYNYILTDINKIDSYISKHKPSSSEGSEALSDFIKELNKLEFTDISAYDDEDPFVKGYKQADPNAYRKTIVNNLSNTVNKLKAVETKIANEKAKIDTILSKINDNMTSTELEDIKAELVAIVLPDFTDIDESARAKTLALDTYKSNSVKSLDEKIKLKKAEETSNAAELADLKAGKTARTEDEAKIKDVSNITDVNEMKNVLSELNNVILTSLQGKTNKFKEGYGDKTVIKSKLSDAKSFAVDYIAGSEASDTIKAELNSITVDNTYSSDDLNVLKDKLNINIPTNKSEAFKKAFDKDGINSLKDNKLSEINAAIKVAKAREAKEAEINEAKQDKSRIESKITALLSEDTTNMTSTELADIIDSLEVIKEEITNTLNGKSETYKNSFNVNDLNSKIDTGLNDIENKKALAEQKEAEEKAKAQAEADKKEANTSATADINAVNDALKAVLGPDATIDSINTISKLADLDKVKEALDKITGTDLSDKSEAFKKAYKEALGGNDLETIKSKVNKKISDTEEALTETAKDLKTQAISQVNTLVNNTNTDSTVDDITTSIDKLDEIKTEYIDGHSNDNRVYKSVFGSDIETAIDDAKKKLNVKLNEAKAKKAEADRVEAEKTAGTSAASDDLAKINNILNGKTIDNLSLTEAEALKPEIDKLTPVDLSGKSPEFIDAYNKAMNGISVESVKAGINSVIAKGIEAEKATANSDKTELNNKLTTYEDTTLLTNESVSGLTDILSKLNSIENDIPDMSNKHKSYKDTFGTDVQDKIATLKDKFTKALNGAKASKEVLDKIPNLDNLSNMASSDIEKLKEKVNNITLPDIANESNEFKDRYNADNVSSKLQEAKDKIDEALATNVNKLLEDELVRLKSPGWDNFSDMDLEDIKEKLAEVNDTYNLLPDMTNKSDKFKQVFNKSAETELNEMKSKLETAIKEKEAEVTKAAEENKATETVTDEINKLNDSIPTITTDTAIDDLDNALKSLETYTPKVDLSDKSDDFKAKYNEEINKAIEAKKAEIKTEVVKRANEIKTRLDTALDQLDPNMPLVGGMLTDPTTTVTSIQNIIDAIDNGFNSVAPDYDNRSETFKEALGTEVVAKRDAIKASLKDAIKGKEAYNEDISKIDNAVPDLTGKTTEELEKIISDLDSIELTDISDKANTYKSTYNADAIKTKLDEAKAKVKAKIAEGNQSVKIAKDKHDEIIKKIDTVANLDNQRSLSSWNVGNILSDLKRIEIPEPTPDMDTSTYDVDGLKAYLEDMITKTTNNKSYTEGFDAGAILRDAFMSGRIERDVDNIYNKAIEDPSITEAVIKELRAYLGSIEDSKFADPAEHNKYYMEGYGDVEKLNNLRTKYIEYTKDKIYSLIPGEKYRRFAINELSSELRIKTGGNYEKDIYGYDPIRLDKIQNDLEAFKTRVIDTHKNEEIKTSFEQEYTKIKSALEKVMENKAREIYDRDRETVSETMETLANNYSADDGHDILLEKTREALTATINKIHKLPPEEARTGVDKIYLTLNGNETTFPKDDISDVLNDNDTLSSLSDILFTLYNNKTDDDVKEIDEIKKIYNKYKATIEETHKKIEDINVHSDNTVYMEDMLYLLDDISTNYQGNPLEELRNELSNLTSWKTYKGIKDNTKISKVLRYMKGTPFGPLTVIDNMIKKKTDILLDTLGY